MGKNEAAQLKLIRFARHILHQIFAIENAGKDANAWRGVFHQLVQLIKEVLAGRIPPDRIKELDNLVERIVKNCFNSGDSIDNPSQSDRIKLGNLNEDGGPGSGNWGHAGVKGQLGGSAPGGGSQNRTGSSETGYSSEAKEKANASGASGGSAGGTSAAHPKSGSMAAADHDLGPGISKAAQAAYDKARENEAKITPDLQKIAGSLSCEMRGLEYSVKTASSTRDKIERKRHQAQEEGKALPSDEEIVKGMGDLVRYTAVSPHDEMAGTARKFIDQLEQEGYTVTKLENKWLDAKPYSGIHLDVVSDAGQKFELQIHSNESLAVKEKLHPLYEEQRKPSTSKQRKTELDGEMMNLARSMSRPKGIDDLKNFERGDFVSCEYSIQSEWPNILCRRVRTDDGLQDEMWSVIQNMWIPDETACAVNCGFESSRTVTEEEAMRIIKEKADNAKRTA